MKSALVASLLLTACHSGHSAPAAVSCAADETLDGSTCVPEACGVGAWGTLPVDGNTVYVNIEAAEGGDGSETAPLTSIQAGVDLAGERGGGLVAVAAGTYVEVIAMGSGHDGVTLAGRCRELVTIDGSRGDPNGEDVPAIEIIGGRQWPEVGIEGVTVRGGTYTGVWVQEATVSVRGSDMRENVLAGVLASEAELTMDEVGVYDTQPSPDGTGGPGLDIEDGAALTATGCNVQANTGLGIYAAGAGTTVDLQDTDILDTQPSPDGAFGRGIDVEDGAALTTTGCTVQDNTEFGIYAAGAGTTVELQDTGILDTQPSPDGTGGPGLDIEDGAALTATGCNVQGNTGLGIYAAGVGTTVDLQETDILDTQPSPDGTFGRGIDVEDGAALSATGCTVQENTEFGIFATGGGTTVDLQDTDILDTQPSADSTGGFGIELDDGAALTATGCTVQGNTKIGIDAAGAGTIIDLQDTAILNTRRTDGGGWGIQVWNGAALTATGCTVQGNTEAGIVAAGAGTTVDLQDTDILDSQPSPDATFGGGISVQDGAALTAAGCTVQGNTDLGIAAQDAGTTVDLQDTEIFDTQPSSDGTGGGRGISVQDGAALTAIGCTVQGNTEVGIVATGDGATVDLQDTGILDTQPSPNGTGGRGIGAQDGAALTATRCTVQGNAEVGIFATGEASTVDLQDTVVTETRRARVTGLALGLGVQSEASLRATGGEVSATEGCGVHLAGGLIELLQTRITSNTFAGAVVVAGSLTLSGATITDSLPDSEWGGGFGVYALDIAGATLTLLDSTIGPHDYAALWLDGPGTYDIEHNTLSGSGGFAQGSATLHGNAVFAENGVTAWDGATGLLLSGNTFSDSSGIGVLLHASSAAMSGNSWSSNDTDVRQQDCEDVTPLKEDDLLGVPNAVVCPESNVLIAYDIEFSSLYLPEVEPEE